MASWTKFFRQKDTRGWSFLGLILGFAAGKIVFLQAQESTEVPVAAETTTQPVQSPKADQVAEIPVASVPEAAPVSEGSHPEHHPMEVAQLRRQVSVVAPLEKETERSSPKPAQKRSRVASRKLKTKRRMPASLALPAEDEVAVYDEKTSFEQMVTSHQATAGRSPASFAPQARVIAVRRELGLTRKEADAAPQDIVLNAGVESGLNEGMVLSVARSVPILDPYRDNLQKQLEVEFAKIKIIHSQNQLAIARVQKIDDIRRGLAIGTRAVLIGDYVGQFSK